MRTIRDIGAIPTGMNSLLDVQYILFQLSNQLQGNYIQEMTTEQRGLNLFGYAKPMSFFQDFFQLLICQFFSSSCYILSSI